LAFVDRMRQKNGMKRTGGSKKSDGKESPVTANADEKKASTVIILSLSSIAAIVACSALFALVVGGYLGSRGIVSFRETPVLSNLPTSRRPSVSLPPPPLLAGKGVPTTRYTSKLFEEGSRVSTALLNHDGSAEYSKDEDGNQICDMNLTKHADQQQPVMDTMDSEEDAVYEPAGQHLLVDIKNVAASFLDSEERLATAMLDVIKQSELTLLSYHCHGLEPVGVSCVGVLLESHVSFHTWPIEGVITLDLFTCGPKSLLPLVDIIKKLFGVSRETGDDPFTVWTHKQRGFRYNEDEHFDTGLSDLERFLGDQNLEKDGVFSSHAGIQKIDIYDSIEPRFRSFENYQRSLSKDGSYESKHPELFQKDRLLFLDGVLQSRNYGESAYHDALVHPAMITHKEPKRILIVGGGGGAVLREVLKHNTVEKVVMLEVDTDLTKAAQTYLSGWSDCSDLVGGTESCFDDPRVEVNYVDPVDWITKKFSGKDVAESDRFDIVIIDAM
jgi:S-adenosylmethionine decarboxylase proenzyme